MWCWSGRRRRVDLDLWLRRAQGQSAAAGSLSPWKERRRVTLGRAARAAAPFQAHEPPSCVTCAALYCLPICSRYVKPSTPSRMLCRVAGTCRVVWRKWRKEEDWRKGRNEARKVRAQSHSLSPINTTHPPPDRALPSTTDRTALPASRCLGCCTENHHVGRVDASRLPQWLGLRCLGSKVETSERHQVSLSKVQYSISTVIRLCHETAPSHILISR